MDTTAIIVLSVCAAVFVLALALVLYQRRRSRALQREFGPEYDQTVQRSRRVSEAERALEARRKRVEALDIRPLSREQAERYAGEWRDVQARFVDEPERAIADADRLLTDVMMARGYPVSDFERRIEDLSVGHGQVIAKYRAAHNIAVAREMGGDPDTEQVRRAFVSYRDVFEDLLGSDLAKLAG